MRNPQSWSDPMHITTQYWSSCVRGMTKVHQQCSWALSGTAVHVLDAVHDPLIKGYSVLATAPCGLRVVQLLSACGARRSYIELELQLGEIERVRTLYQKYLQWAPANCRAWCKYAEVEQSLGELARVRAIYELAIEQPVLDMPEVLWKVRLHPAGRRIRRAQQCYPLHCSPTQEHRAAQQCCMQMNIASCCYVALTAAWRSQPASATACRAT